MCFHWILYFQLKKKIAMQRTCSRELRWTGVGWRGGWRREFRDCHTTPTSTSTTRRPSTPPPPPPPPTSRAAKKSKTDGTDMAEELSRRSESACLLNECIGALLDTADESQLSRRGWQWMTGMMLHINYKEIQSFYEESSGQMMECDSQLQTQFKGLPEPCVIVLVLETWQDPFSWSYGSQQHLCLRVLPSASPTGHTIVASAANFWPKQLYFSFSFFFPSYYCNLV